MQGNPNPTSKTLGRLSPELEALLRGRAKRRHLAKRESLYRYGSAPDALFCVESGLIRLSVTAGSGREAVLSSVPAGHWFGEASLFIDAPRIHDARAVVDSDLLVLPAADFHDIVDNRPDFLLEFVRLICGRYRLTLEQMDAGVLLPLPVRLAQRILTLPTTQSQSSGSDVPIELKLSQEELAHMLGVSRQSVNRQLKEWEANGIVRLKYGRVTLTDPDALRALVREGREL